MTAGNIDAIMDNYGRSLVISKRLLPYVRDTNLQNVLSERIKDFEGLVGKLRSGEKNVNNIQGVLNTLSDSIANTLRHVVGAVQNVVKGILDGIFGLLNLPKK